MGKKYIFNCTCSGVREKSVAAFKAMFPDEEMPEMKAGKEKIKEFANSFPSDSNASKHLSAIAKKSGRFSYYISISDNYDIEEMIDLRTGKRVY